uniref:Mitochondrial ribosomal protein S18C n=1 Tax=Cairina moschata TaxID=8855 RepID=A0A8C3CEV3_CAIMO
MLALLTASGEQAALGPAGGRLRLRAAPRRLLLRTASGGSAIGGARPAAPRAAPRSAQHAQMPPLPGARRGKYDHVIPRFHWPERLGREPRRAGSDVAAAVPVEMENPYKEPPKKCVLCGIKVDYKNVQVSVTGLCLCNKKQKEISKTIKRAQVLGFMPVMFKNTAFLTDPKICNIKY